MQKNNEEAVTIEDVPIIDLMAWHNAPDKKADNVIAACRQVSECLHRFGILIVRDPRAVQKDNSDYIDMVEEYFESRGNQLYSGGTLDDARPEHHYLVGVIPENQEMARNHARRMARYTEANKPISPIDPVYDAKWRFHWKIGERPAEATDNFAQVIPKDFPNWEKTMDTWGYKLHDAVYDIAQMSAVGLGLPEKTFVDKLDGGPHLLAPTGSDLTKNDVGAIFAGFHYDIAFLTAHGKTRFPGLFVWLRNNQKLQIKVPDGCLLMQAGKQFEHITGGYVLAGFHEVVYTEATKKKYLEAKEVGKSHWRVSSTMFTQFRYNVDCSPMPELSDKHRENAVNKYPPMSAFDILMTELAATNMVLESSEFSNLSNPEMEVLVAEK